MGLYLGNYGATPKAPFSKTIHNYKLKSVEILYYTQIRSINSLFTLN